MHPTGLLGVALFLALAWLLSENRARFPWRIVVGGVALQVVIALLLLKTPGVLDLFEGFAWVVNGVITQADAGIEFVFGPNLADPSGPWGMIFAVRVLPVIIYFAALMAVLYHLGLMQRIVAAFAWVLRRTLGVTGAEALAMAANIFVGQTEAPLCIRPFLSKLTRAQWATLMVGGFATIAGSVLAAYVTVLAGVGEGAAPLRVEFIKHLLTASVMSAPAAFVIARLIVPETESPPDEDVHSAPVGQDATNVLDAAAHGATDGLKLALNVGAMLIAFLGLLALVNWPLREIGRIEAVDAWLAARNIEDLGLETILGWCFTPVAWAMGVAWNDCAQFGSLLGQKLILTEFVAYLSLADMLHAEGGATISARSARIATYALCGFANFASIAIQIGGLTALAPDRRADIVSLSLKAMLGGAMASWMTASIAGVFIS
jgi:CNT family concentrative nucleoside transporter